MLIFAGGFRLPQIFRERGKPHIRWHASLSTWNHFPQADPCSMREPWWDLGRENWWWMSEGSSIFSLFSMNTCSQISFLILPSRPGSKPTGVEAVRDCGCACKEKSEGLGFNCSPFPPTSSPPKPTFILANVLGTSVCSEIMSSCSEAAAFKLLSLWKSPTDLASLPMSTPKWGPLDSVSFATANHFVHFFSGNGCF